MPVVSRAALVRKGAVPVGVAGIAAVLGFAAAIFLSQGGEDSVPVSEEPVAADGSSSSYAEAVGGETNSLLPRVSLELYVSMRGLSSVADVARLTDGAAQVDIQSVHDVFYLLGDRRPATQEDVEGAARIGKRIELGQEIGPEPTPFTRYQATIRWLDGTTEEALVLFTGGEYKGRFFESADLPLPDVGRRYFFFLRRTDKGLVPEPVQFTVARDGALQSWTFPHTGLAKQLAGKTVAAVAGEVAAAYAARGK